MSLDIFKNLNQEPLLFDIMHIYCDSIYVDLQLINDFNFISDFHRVMKLNGMLYMWYNIWINIHIYMYNQFKSKSVNIKSVINSKL